MKTVGQIIKEKRLAKGWSTYRLGKEIGTTHVTILSWETTRTFPNALYLMDLADVFGCTIDELCGRNFKGDNNGSKTKN